MCPIFFFIPFTRGEVSFLLANTLSLPIFSGSNQPVSRPCLFSHFLTIKLFSSAYTVLSEKPSLHSTPSASCSFYLKFSLSRANFFRVFYALFTLQSFQNHFCPYHVWGLTKASMLWNPVTFSPSLSYSTG